MPTEVARIDRPGWRRKRAARTAMAVILAALVTAASIAVLSGHYQLQPVLSGSMRPGLPVGGVVVTHRVPTASLELQDVIVFHRPDRPNELVVHRITALTPGPNGPVVQTRGDANTKSDPWRVTLEGSTAYRAVFAVPLLGYASVWLHSPAGRWALVAVGLLLVSGAAVGGRSRRNPPVRPGSSRRPNYASSGLVRHAATATSMPAAHQVTCEALSRANARPVVAASLKPLALVGHDIDGARSLFGE